MNPEIPPIRQDAFGFTSLESDGNASALFPIPDSNKLVTGLFSGSLRTNMLLSMPRMGRTAARDFLHRLSTFTIVGGHKPYAFRLNFHGDWGKQATRKFEEYLRKESVVTRIAMVTPSYIDASPLQPNASALVWAEIGQGTPSVEAEAGDVIICAADVDHLSPEHKTASPKPYPDWGKRLLLLKSKKYPHKPNVVRHAVMVDDISITSLRKAFDSESSNQSISFDDTIRKFYGRSGIAIVCAPHFANGAARRLFHLNRGAKVEIVGRFSPLD